MENVNLKIAKDLADRWLAEAKARGVSARQLLETMLDGLEEPTEEDRAIALEATPEPEPEIRTYGSESLSFGKFARLAGWGYWDAQKMRAYLDRQSRPREPLTDPETQKSYVYVWADNAFHLV